jgi:nucleotide-binding universal stress UspA family protein
VREQQVFMPTPRTVLCPVDFSESSRRALTWACALFPESGVIVLNAVDPLLVEAAKIRLGMDLAGAEVGPALRTFVDGACISGAPSRVEMVLQVRTGQPADVILETASAVAADLIVMGTHGLGGFRKWVLGSTTEHVLRRTATPVLAIPAGREEPLDSLHKPSTSRVRLILAATDFSNASTHALDCAATLARELDAALLLVHIVEPISVPPWWTADMSGLDEERMATARAKLQQLTRQFSVWASCETTVTLGRPVDSIAAVADHRHAGLIVMGLAGGGQLFGARPGSIAYGVLSLATAPVLVVPPRPSASASHSETS